MADNYSQATLGQYIPADVFTEDELTVFGDCGWDYEGTDTLYFYCELGAYDFDELDPTDITEEDIEEHPWLRSEEFKAFYVENGIISAENAFQIILRRLDEKQYPYITEEGAYTCSKMRQDEFGGWATFITRDNMEGFSTSSWLGEKMYKFKKEKEVQD